MASLTKIQEGDALNFVAVRKQSGQDYLACGALNRQHEKCTNDAGRGTDHLGIGRCSFHGGRNQSASAKNYKHGMNAKIIYPHILQRIEELKKNRDVFDMREHIFLLEAILEDVLQHAETSQDAFPTVVKAVDTATKAIQRLHDVEVGRRYVISVENVGNIIDRVTSVIERHVPDPYTRSLIAEDLMRVYTTPQASLLAPPIDVTPANGN